MARNLTLHLENTITEFNFEHEEKLELVAELPMSCVFKFLKILA